MSKKERKADGRSGKIKKNRTIYLVLLIVLVGACVLSLFAGAVSVPVGEMFQSGVIRLRLARILLAVVAGAGLSVAGVVFQALLRNPLAEPYVLGVSSGAGLGAAIAIIIGAGIMGIWTLPIMAFAGAVITIFVVYSLARSAGGAVPVHTLLLSGVIVSAVLGSILMFIVSICPSENLHNVVWWLLGNLQIFDWPLLRVVSVVVAACVVVTVLFARDLNIMTLGEEPAAHLGLNVELTKKMFFLVASLMTGATVAACGLIGFVGLIVPHSVRLIVGPDHRRLVPASAMAGAIFLVLADGFARTVIAPMEIPIGVITAFLGGPFFLFLLRRRKRSYWS
jgi:iron complex transport system permease protein